MSDLKDNEIKITKVPHSGDIGLEFPVNDFDNTSLAEADGRGLLTVPDTANLTETPTPHERIAPKGVEKHPSDNPFVRFFQSRRNQVISGAAGLTLLATGATVAAVNANNSPQLEPVPGATSEPFTPGPETTPEPTTPETIPAELVAFKEMTPEAFAALPKAEQAPYIAFLYKDMDSFVADWKAQLDTPNDVYAEGSVTDEVQEAYANNRWMLRRVLSFDKDDAYKALNFILYDGTASVDYAEWASAIEIKAERPAAAMAESRAFPIRDVISADGPINENGLTFYDNVVVPANGEGSVNSRGSLVFVEYPEANLSFWSQTER